MELKFGYGFFWDTAETETEINFIDDPAEWNSLLKTHERKHDKVIGPFDFFYLSTYFLKTKNYRQQWL